MAKVGDKDYVNLVNLENGEMPIRKFDLHNMVFNPTICMIAKRGSGKSWVVRDILKRFSTIPGGVVIAPTDEMSCFYGNFIPEAYIYYEFDTNIISSIFSRQKRMIEKYKEYKEKGKKVDPRIFLVMDDCLSSKLSWVKDPNIAKIFFDGRHYHIMYILTMQFPLGIPPEYRTNFDYVFLLADDFISNKKRLYEHYCGMFPSLNIFCQVFDRLTQDFSCMIVNNRGERATILDKIFWYKATNKPDTKFGCSQYNKFNDDNYDEEWRDRNVLDPNKFMDDNKKKTIRIGKLE
jgi:hypothetical protein